MPLPTADALFWICVGSCAVAQLAIIRSVVRSRAAASMSPDATERVPRPHFAVELAWAIVPALALVALFVATWRAMHP